MKNIFFYELNCVEDGEWIPEKQTLEDILVMNLRRSWKHRYNLESRYSRQYLQSPAARWRFNRQQRESRKKHIRELRAYRSNRRFAPDILQSLESWYLRNRKNRFAFIVNGLLRTSWTEDLSLFRSAKTWEHNLQAHR